MARPKMAFTPDEAVSVIFYLRSGLTASDFWSKNGIPDHTDFDTTYKAALELNVLYEIASPHLFRRSAPNKVPFPLESVEALKLWLTTYLSEQGWQRIQAARRQKKHSLRHQELVPVEMTFRTRYRLEDLVKSAGVPRPEYLEQLVDLLMFDPQGQALISKFHAQLGAKSYKAAITMVAELTKLDESSVRTVVFEAVGLDPRLERKVFLEMAKLGKTKLLKALRAKEGTVQVRLAEVVVALGLTEGTAPP